MNDAVPMYVLIYSPTFAAAWKGAGLTDEDQRRLEFELCAGPLKWPVEPGTGGLRKARFSPPSLSVGKSGGARVYYVFFPEFEVIGVFHAYLKSVTEVLGADDKKAMRALVARFKELARKQNDPEKRR